MPVVPSSLLRYGGSHRQGLRGPLDARGIALDVLINAARR